MLTACVVCPTRTAVRPSAATAALMSPFLSSASDWASCATASCPAAAPAGPSPAGPSPAPLRL